MTLTSEVGHAKNVANFNLLITAAESYGNKYNPPSLLLQLPQLYTISIIAQDKLASVAIQNTAYKNAVNARKEAFSSLQQIFTDVLTTLETCTSSGKNLELVREFHRKIHGNGLNKDTIKSFKLSYEQAAQLFDGLLSVLLSEPDYNPVDTTLSITNMQSTLEWLKQQNKAKSLAFDAIKNIRKERNIVLYHPETGLLAIAAEVKKYLHTIFDFESPQLKSINKLRFKKPKM